MKEVITVVVTYNRKELLMENLIALLNIDYKENKILIIDNNSTDGTFGYIKDFLNKHSNFIYKNTGANLGGAGGFNYGIKEAYKIGCDFVWVMDDDCIVHKDSLSKLIEADKKLNGKYGFLSSKVLWKDNSICKMNIPKKTFSKWLKDFDRNYQKIVMSSFVSLFIPTSIIKEIGLPIKEFFIWTDDWEYTRRISREYKCYYITDSIVTHKCKDNIGASIATIPSDRMERCHYLYRNDVVLYRREGLKGKILLWIRLLLHKYRVMKANLPDKKQRIEIINKATKEGKNFFPKTEYVFSPNETINVLEFFGEPFNFGGQEAFMINMYSNFENSNIHYTFATPFDCHNQQLMNLIKEKDGSLIVKNYNSGSILKKIYLEKTLNKILKENKYDVIHIQSSSLYNLYISAKIAKKRGVRKVIVHSHAAGNNTFKYRLVKKYSDKRINNYADRFFACSQLAGEWKFPKEVLKSSYYKIIPNGIDTKKYTFNQDIRLKIRKQLNFSKDDLVFCHVGRFSPEKNHQFFIQLLPLIEKQYQNFKFIFVGAGETKQDFLIKMKELNLMSHLIFLEKIDYVNEVLMASDMFLFPSVFEGLGLVEIEAQASGLFSICSTSIPKEALLTNIIYSLSLDSKLWISKIKELVPKLVNIDRKQYSSIVASKGYDAKQSALILEREYLE